MSVIEHHRTEIGAYLTLSLDITSDGDVVVGFQIPNSEGETTLKLSLDELRELVGFVEKHGQVSTQWEQSAA